MASRSTFGTVTAVLLIILGFLAVLLPFEAGLAVAVVVGWLFIIGGIIYLAHAFGHGAAHAVWNIIIGLVYLAGGIYMIIHPGAGLITLTIVLAWLFFIEAIIEIVRWFATRELPGSGWVLFNAIVTLILAFLIWRHWPASSLWAVGTLIGISLMMSGFSRLMYGRSSTRLLPV